MFTGKVIGSVVATRKDDKLTGVKLLVVVPLDSKGKPNGKPLVAVDTVGAGTGELVYLSKSREASLPKIVRGAPVDAAIVGIIDHLDTVETDDSDLGRLGFLPDPSRGEDPSGGEAPGPDSGKPAGSRRGGP